MRQRFLLIFVDGLGWPKGGFRKNPICADICPTLVAFMLKHGVPVDATLGVPGLPQSATGQTALLSGINAPAVLGRHLEGFPNAELRSILEENNILSSFVRAGKKSVFANAYIIKDFDDLIKHRKKSVTTVSALSAMERVLTTKDMLAGKAVFHDLTRETARARGYDGPLITPEQAGLDLLGIAKNNDFTLFEYFQTDRAGHSGDMEYAVKVLQELDGFIAIVVAGAKKSGITVMLASDHGNIEDMTRKSHTLNPVPFAVSGRGALRLRKKVKRLDQIAPAIIELARLK